VHKIKTSWQKQIGMSVAKSRYIDAGDFEKSEKKWKAIEQKRVSTHLRLYTSLCQFEA